MLSPVIFVGPSAERDELAAVCPGAEFLRPVRRGDLYRAREAGASVFLIIDGVFSHQLAVSPREIIDILRDGAVVFGASSMGAVRSAECWPVGMRGCGVIARLYRLGWLDSDDEVAVSINPADSYSALSVALINVRFAVSRARRTGLDKAMAAAIVAMAKSLPFPDRTWPLILSGAGAGNRAQSLEGMLRKFDLKRRDALLAASSLARLVKKSDLVSHGPASRRMFSEQCRYPGHDRFFGFDPQHLSIILAKWLFATGRYQPYIWPIVSGDPELAGIRQSAAPETSPAEARRDCLAAILARRLPDLHAIASELWDELEFVDELDAELMRWYACQTLFRAGTGPDPYLLERVCGEVAIHHGVTDWETLEGEVVDGKLFGAIPIDWIQKACSQIAQARASADLPLLAIEHLQE